jgi:hypothetical protein
MVGFNNNRFRNTIRQIGIRSFFAKVSEPGVITTTESPDTPVLVIMPGARKRGEWMKIVEHYAIDSGSPLKTEPVDLGKISSCKIIFGSNFESDIDNAERLLINVQSAYRGREINLACHSFSGYLLKEVLNRNPEMRFKFIFMLGSVIRREDSEVICDHAERVFCDRTNVDLTACHLEVFFPSQFERTSVIGYYNGKGNVVNRIFKGNHTSLASLNHFENFIFPCVQSGIPLLPSTIIEPFHSSDIVRNLRIFYFIIFPVTILAVLLLKVSCLINDASGPPA